jgi:hypothetical protein
MVCEVAMVNYWIAFLTGGLCIGLVVFLGLIVFFRRYLIINSVRFQMLEDHLERRRRLNRIILADLREKEKEILEHEKRIEALISNLNHLWLGPIMKRFRGLADLGMRPVETLEKNIKNALDNIVIAKKPNHYRYAELAEKDIAKLNEQNEEIKIWWKLGIELCLNIEKDIKNEIHKLTLKKQ